MVGFRHGIGTQALGCIQRVRHRDHIRRIGLRQLVHEVDDTRQFVDRIGDLFVRDPEPRQQRNMLYLFLVQ